MSEKDGIDIHRRQLSSALNRALNNDHQENAKQFVSIRQPLTDLLGRHVVIELDSKNKPIPLDQIQAQEGKGSARKIVIELAKKSQYFYYFHSGVQGKRMPTHRLRNLLYEKAGWEVIVVDPGDDRRMHNETYSDRLVKNLVKKIATKH